MEVAAQSPKSITRLLAEEVVQGSEDVPQSPVVGTPTAPKATSASAGKLPPPPPVVTMSLSMKTVVSPRTHTHEVVALSALVHREVRLDGASDEDGKKVGNALWRQGCSLQRFKDGYNGVKGGQQRWFTLCCSIALFPARLGNFYVALCFCSVIGTAFSIFPCPLTLFFACQAQMSAWIGIRPLGQSAGEEFPKVFPHDLKSEVGFLIPSVTMSEI